MNASDSERLDELEIAIAHQGRQIEELSDTVTGQWKTIEELRRKLDWLKDRFAGLEQSLDMPEDNRKPPHW